MCAFDVVANNADRKSGHVLLAEDRLWAIDNGLCFNEDDKLRTVIWDFGGEPLAAEDVGGAGALAARRAPAAPVRAPDTPELAALADRAAWLVHLQALPELVDDGGWPPYPWPSSEPLGAGRSEVDQTYGRSDVQRARAGSSSTVWDRTSPPAGVRWMPSGVRTLTTWPAPLVMNGV